MTARFIVQRLGTGYFAVRDSVTELDVATRSSEAEADKVAEQRNEQTAEVAACTSRHSKAPVAKCADCRICDECDVTLDLTSDGRVLCEVCREADEQKRAEADDRLYYTTIRSLHR